MQGQFTNSISIFDSTIFGQNFERQRWTVSAIIAVEGTNETIWKTEFAGDTGALGVVRFLFVGNPQEMLDAYLREPCSWYEVLGLLRTVGWAQMREIGLMTQQQVSAAARGLNPLDFQPGDFVVRVRYVEGRQACWEMETLDGAVQATNSLDAIHRLLWIAPEAAESSAFAAQCRRFPGRWFEPEQFDTDRRGVSESEEPSADAGEEETGDEEIILFVRCLPDNGCAYEVRYGNGKVEPRAQLEVDELFGGAEFKEMCDAIAARCRERPGIWQEVLDIDGRENHSERE